jgi:asparagine synthase (glutamine-hydrolysing)
MCGIAGKLSTTEPVGRALIEKMCAVVEHRGPDSRGVFLDDGVGLGIQRLRVIDLETGDQPIFSEDGSIVVVLNGEIYNYEELRSQLQREGHRFGTKGDTEVIVHLYEDLGVECVQALRGMFAFALWDRTRRRLLIARDRLGKKPLFYASRDGDFWFGSEAKSILEDTAVEREVDFDAIDSYLHYQYVPHPLCAFRGLRKLPPAHTLVWEDGRVDVARYWKLSYRRGAVETEIEAQEAIREQLLEATRLRLRSDVPLGAFLSGGVDSSAVVAAMAMVGGHVKTFSIGFDVEAYDETAYAREVARLFDTDHYELRIEPRAMEILPRLVWHYGEPFADSSAIPSFYLAELTRRYVTVALNGDGGDENFAGYRRHVANVAVARLAHLPEPARLALARFSKLIGRDGRADSFRPRLGRAVDAALMPPDARYAHWMAFFTEQEREQLYAPDFRAALGDGRFAPAVVEAPYRESDAEDAVNRLLDLDVHTQLPCGLLVKMDIATMAHSLEVRSPLLDHRFMELAAGLPGSWKLQARTRKKIFKDALRPWLPDHILDRPKTGFGVPIGTWFRGELKNVPREILLDPRSLERGFFREARLRGIIDEHVAGVHDHANKLWALIQLELWLRTFVDTTANRPLALSVV